MTIGNERRVLTIVNPSEGVGDNVEIEVVSHYAAYELSNDVNERLANNWKIIQGLEVTNRSHGNVMYTMVMGRYKGNSE